jgi:probable rRNA maturation factor
MSILQLRVSSVKAHCRLPLLCDASLWSRNRTGSKPLMIATYAGNNLVILRKRIAGLSRQTLERFVLRARRAVGLPGTVNILITNNSELRALNRRFREEDKTTDVLSFPAPRVGLHQTSRGAGEIAISAVVARENASRLGHSVEDEVKILVLHGLLHLAGYDHEHDDGEMARKESRLRRQLKLEKSLIERMQPKNPHPSRGNRRQDQRRPAGRRAA